MINTFGYRNKIDVYIIVDYLDENNTHSKVQNLEEIMVIFLMLMIKLETIYITIHLERVICEESIIVSIIFHNS